MVTRGQRGFTLLEVLIAVAIAGVSLGLIFELFGSALNSIEISRNMTQATVLARQKMEEAISLPLTERSEEGDFEDEFSGYHWQVEVSSQGDIVPPEQGEGVNVAINLFQIRALVSWQAKGRSHQVEFTTLKAEVEKKEL